MRSVTRNQFPIKILLIGSNSSLVWGLVTWIQICASVNHHKKMKAEHSRLIRRKLTENLKAFHSEILLNRLILVEY